ncbi:hypothetical protein BT67DRAFT_223804 [Trichocladium antarcticum]|uniref:Uncharacterized protein n=1 Tax=Trichocladium antarcticum TaxID=1450529 RepID=A0AAN6UC33_9PEZI|nr:hypothetical protein BT67DRAFT_223804 [Trichocladium antarcticum]
MTDTARVGTGGGRTGGSADVVVNTRVNDTGGVFAPDASIFPSHSTGNPSAAIVTAAVSQ